MGIPGLYLAPPPNRTYFEGLLKRFIKVIFIFLILFNIQPLVSHKTKQSPVRSIGYYRFAQTLNWQIQSFCPLSDNFLQMVKKYKIWFLTPVVFERYGFKKKQEAQLSQRDRATAAWISFGQNITGRGYLSRTFRSVFKHCDAIGLPIYRIRWNNAK